MLKIARKTLTCWATCLANLFLLVQVACDLYLPTVTANLVDKGIIGKNLPYIWQTGGKMLLVSALGLRAAFGNIYFASHQAMQVGQRLRAMLFAKVLTFSDEEISRFGLYPAAPPGKVFCYRPASFGGHHSFIDALCHAAL